ncbi:MAG: adenylosuccinate lyase [Verrucomicrobiales bacterium]
MADALIPNILAQRYASKAMAVIWSPEGRVRAERELWIAVMKAQRRLGLDISAEAIAAYEAVKDRVDLASIRERERATRHDIKARIDEFCALAGREDVHKGMTSRDLTENVEQWQIFRSLRLMRVKAAAAALALANRAEEDAGQTLTARTHNVPAQLTTLGRRWAMFGEELLNGFCALKILIENYPLRGLKGAVGTQLDQWTLLQGDAAKIEELENEFVSHLGMRNKLTATGQVYPRSLDFRVVACLCDLGSAPANFARTVRLMAGHETLNEGFAKGQSGSSAMPHKTNSRSCERINGLHAILKGHLTMAASLAGDQWNEGDVSCSVVRRVVLPDAFFAIDGVFETFLTVVEQMQAYPAAIHAENQRYLPFLLSTTFLMEAVKQGVGRETAHEIIKEHALAAAESLRSGEAIENDLAARLAGDPRLRLSAQLIEAALEQGSAETGAASKQVEAMVSALRRAAEDCPEAAHYRPESIL